MIPCMAAIMMACPDGRHGQPSWSPPLRSLRQLPALAALLCGSTPCFTLCTVCFYCTLLTSPIMQYAMDEHPHLLTVVLIAGVVTMLSAIYTSISDPGFLDSAEMFSENSKLFKYVRLKPERAVLTAFAVMAFECMYMRHSNVCSALQQHQGVTAAWASGHCPLLRGRRAEECESTGVRDGDIVSPCRDKIGRKARAAPRIMRRMPAEAQAILGADLRTDRISRRTYCWPHCQANL